MNLSVQLLSEHARIPLKGSKNAAGFDLFSAYDYEIPSHGRMLCATDIAVAIPPRHYGRVGIYQLILSSSFRIGPQKLHRCRRRRDRFRLPWTSWNSVVQLRRYTVHCASRRSNCTIDHRKDCTANDHSCRIIVRNWSRGQWIWIDGNMIELTCMRVKK